MFKHSMDDLKKVLPENAKAVVLPFAFPVETTKEQLDENWIKPGMNEYMDVLKELGITNIDIINCYDITKENNFYGYKAWYPGFGMLNDMFYIDVYTKNDEDYIIRLKKIANKRNKIIYALHENDCILLDRSTNEYKVYGIPNIINPY